MEEYLLFIDTETTGLPRRWNRPYAVDATWPHVAQVAWQVYTTAGTLVKEENQYLQVPQGTMQAKAVAVHGLTPAFLQAQGQPPRPVLAQLHHDLLTYRPRVVGYFLQLDFHVLGAAFHRAGLPNLLPALPQFCLMRVATLPDTAGPARRYQRLAELHEELFQLPLPRLHDAYEDAAATARCFFELRRSGRISVPVLIGQPALHEPLPRAAEVSRWLGWTGFGVLLLLLLTWLWIS